MGIFFLSLIYFNILVLKCKNNTYLCQNGGFCSNITGKNNNSVIGFKCDCPIGYYGSLCELSNF